MIQVTDAKTNRKMIIDETAFIFIEPGSIVTLAESRERVQTRNVIAQCLYLPTAIEIQETWEVLVELIHPAEFKH